MFCIVGLQHARRRRFIGPLFALAVSLALPLTGAAQSIGGAIRPLLAAGLTFGGEELISAEFADGYRQTVTTGGFLDLKAGMEYQLIQSPWSLQMTAGYQADTAQADNGRFEFTRIPVELILMTEVSPQWRIGFGLRRALSTEVSASGEAAKATQFGKSTSFNSDLGLILQGEYRATDQLALQARFVKERYSTPSHSGWIDGSHFGVFGVVYFN